MRRLLATLASAAFILALPNALQAQETLIDLGSKGARVSRAAPGARLAPPTGSRVEAVRAYLRQRLDDGTLAEIVQTKDHAFRGRGHAEFRQRAGGLEVYGTYVKATYSVSGDLLSVVENLVSTARPLRAPQVGPDAALRSVIARYYPGAAADLRELGTIGDLTTFERGPFSEAPTARRVAVPLTGPALDTGYLVVTWDRNNVLRHTLVSGRGQIISEELRTNEDGFNVFQNHPGVSAQAIVSGPAASGAGPSPNGWLGSNTTTIGNNVDAYLDRNNDNAADAGGRPTTDASQVFNFVWNGTIAPTDVTNQKAAVTNLFYLNNVLHDRLYGYGFTEGAGNFQSDNFGRGGLGNDPVNAEAQDGGGTNNANFATPSDGSRPRMQMYLWTSPTPDRDGDLDSDIVYHEYGHGLTWRMIGGMTGPMAGAIGEGMADVLALYFNGDDRVGEYSTGNPIGIRSAPYTNYSRSYGDFSGTGVHFNGEIYAATMWRLRQLWVGKGWDTERLLGYVVDGMNDTPSRPAFEDMRTGILTAIGGPDSAGSERCVVWEAFAQFGIGQGADGVERCRGLNCSVTITESFAVPATCSGAPNTAPTVQISSPVASGGSVSVTQGAPVSFAGSANDTQDGVLSPSLSWSSSLQGAIGSGAGFSIGTLSLGTHTITASVTDSGGLPGSNSIQVTVTSPGGGTITLTAAGVKIKGERHADLSWSGASSGGVDIYRDGALVREDVPNVPQPYRDVIGGKGGGTFTYRVCNANSTTTCSNTVNVVF